MFTGGDIYHRRIIHPMKPLPTPHVEGKTEFERFDNAVRRVLSVPQEEVPRREAQEKKLRDRMKRPRK